MNRSYAEIYIRMIYSLFNTFDKPNVPTYLNKQEDLGLFTLGSSKVLN